MVHILLVIMIYFLMGGLILQFMYHHQSVYFIVPMVYIHVVFIFIVYIYIVYAYFVIHICTPGFTFYHLCDIYPQLDGNFWEVYAYLLYHMQLMCVLKCYII